MRYLVVAYIKTLPADAVIRLRELYSKVYARFPKECDVMGFTPTVPIEEKWKKEIRFGLQDAKNDGLIQHIGSDKSGRWKRL